MISGDLLENSSACKSDPVGIHAKLNAMLVCQRLNRRHVPIVLQQRERMRDMLFIVVGLFRPHVRDDESNLVLSGDDLSGNGVFR